MLLHIFRKERDFEEGLIALHRGPPVDPHRTTGTLQSERARALLRNALGGKRFEYLLALLAFIRIAHYWTVVHPGLEIEDDVRELLSTHKELAALLLQDPDAGHSEPR